VIDDVPTVKKTYATLIRTRAECLAVMQPGSKLSEVHAAATAFLEKKSKSLLKNLPKSLGFSLGLDFKDSTFNLSAKVDPSLIFEPGMIFNLAVGFQDVDVPLAEREKAKGSVKNLGKFSMLVADTVKINSTGIPDVLTKASIEWDDVNYNIKEGEGDDEEEDDEDDEDDDAMKDEDEGIQVKTAAGRATVLKSRLRERVAIGDDVLEAKQKRAEKQQRLFEQARDRGLRALANGKGGGSGGGGDDKQVKAEDFKAYPSSELYPYESKGNMIHVDMDNEAILLPINGLPVPFHVSTIKSVNMPDPDAGAYLRLNFYSPDQALGKDAPAQMAAIVNRYKEKDQTFIKEFTFRSLNPAPLTLAFRQIQELRKRVKQKAIVADQEATLVVQPKLIRLKDQRVPRLADIEMRPALSGRKSKGTIDAHANGLRFTSTKTGEHVDIMYVNIKHAFFQPCHAEHIVLIHFHLLNPIMVAKKKTNDIQFITEVVEASEEVTTRGSAYDPDEIESEQRERKMRKVLNRKFQEYTVKVEEVAKKHGFDSLEFDIPYKDLAFQGTPNREMVTLQPSVHCLVNLTETPAFVVSMTSVEHVHFERCTMGAKNFDMVFVPKNHQEPVKMVSMVNMKDFDDIQEWITQQDITFTIGTVNFNWKQTMAMVDGFLEDGTFWDEEDEDGESKPPGWLFLNAGTGDSDDENEEDDEDEEEYQGESGSGESTEDDDSDEEDDESFDDEDDDSDEYDEEEEEEADGQDWEDLEKEAKASDRQREAYEQEEERQARPSKKSKTRR
jgi:nucleosome binding factor SPN SPT16 subunit